MTWSVRHRLALLASLVLLGTAAGCGDNTPGQNGQGGQSGSFEGGAGTGGNAGTDGGLDGDANQGDVQQSDAKEAGGDTHLDMTGETGGASGSDGGAGHDGGGGTGGVGTDGGAGAGGAGADGGAGTGVAGTDGGAGTGVAGTDGGAGTGGATGTAGTGGAGTGGSDAAVDGNAGTDGGTDVVETPPPPSCYAVTFTKPVDQAQLSAADDKDGDQCADGFQYDVVIATGAPNGTSVQLLDGAMLLATVTVSGGTVTFSGVQLSVGANNLSIQFPSTTACTDPSTKAKVTVDCSVPTCTVSRPIISPTHPELNGVSTTLGGDRASSDGSPYEVNFQVTTNIADNQTVALAIDNAASASTISTVSAHASGGVANFVGVPLPGDGTYEVVATCTDGNGVVGTSAKGTYPVDTMPPDLTVSKPSPGAFIGPGGLTAGAFPVCGSTTANDAVNLSASLGARAANYCVSTGGSPVCAAATTVGADTCISVPCPGDAPFSITVTISDKAGNPTQTVLSGITCSSSTPTVQIVTPVTDAPTFTDPTRHLLSANAAQPFRDQNGGVTGAQTDVTACTSRAGTAQLFAGLHGAALSMVPGGSVTTAPAGVLDGCPTGLGFVAKFMGVTLPESAEDPTTGVLTTATELQVTVTDVSSSTGSSTPLDLWVDSTAPVISIASPTNFCGSFHQAFATFNTDISFTTDTPIVTMTIVDGSTTDMLSSPTFAAGTATFSNVAFDVGQSNLAAVASDAAGNTTAVQPVPCTVTVGMQPVVLFNTPQSTNELCTSTGSGANCIDDADPMMPGWQGSISVQVLVGGVGVTTGGVTFFVNGVQVGTEQPLDGLGNATLSNVTLLDGNVTIKAQTDNIPGNGVGSATEMVVVDLGAPNPVTNLAAAVKNRRDTSFHLSWTVPSDFGGGTISGYQVRYAKVQIDGTNFDNPSITTAVPFTSTPGPFQSTDSIDVEGLNIETDYFFAVESVDAAGNLSMPVGTTTATRGTFTMAILSGVGTDNSGFDLNGAGDFGTAGTLDFTPDGLSDLVVGATGGSHVYVYFGTASGYSTTPSITISSTGGVLGFGRSVADIGDIDADGKDDLAISSPNAVGGPKVYIYSRKNPPASWMSAPGTWPSTLDDTKANYVISTPATVTGVIAGRGVQRLGDFDGDGNDDLAISYSGSTGNLGAVIVVKGGPTFGPSLTPDATNSILFNGTAVGGVFGGTVAGIGQFYGSSSPATMVVDALVAGTVYSFTGVSPVGGITTTASADDVTAGSGTDRYGSTIGFLGPLGPSFGALTLAATTGRYVDLHIGTPATGPFLGVAGGAPAASVRFLDALSGNSFGVVNIGSGIRGKSQAGSFIGGVTDTVPDLVLAGQGETNNTIYLVNGAALTTLSGSVDVSTPLGGNIPSIVPVSLANKLPVDWGNGYTMGSAIVDANGDGVADFAIGEFVSGKPGRVAVFY